MLSEPRRVAGAPTEEPADVDPMEFGPWAEEKLRCLAKYLGAYTTILSKQSWVKGYFYIDAFAGSSNLKIRREPEDESTQQYLLEPAGYASDDAGKAEYIKGSPRVALDLEHRFTDYVFIEVNKNRVAQLEELEREAEKKGQRIHIRQQDCNEYLVEWMQRMQGKWSNWRGVVFLDPFGMQVPWNTIAALGKTQAIEVFINFPVGMAIQRLLKRSGQFSPNERAKLDDYFGTNEWFDLLYEKRMDMFGEVGAEKLGGAGDKLVKWYRARLQDAFGHVTTAREVQSITGRPLYYLMFAGPKKTGARIAEDVLKQGARRIQ